MGPNRQYRHWNQTNSREQTMKPNRQYSVDTGCKQTVQSRRWNQTNSKEQPMEPKRSTK